MRHGSLFSGIGGAELAASWMGWENVFHCEINKYNLKLLKQHFTESITYEDIKTTDFSVHRGSIDILTGGFPCQPFSRAGKRKGTEDDRNLWPEMLRAVQQIQPRWIVGENVRGIIDWEQGMVFDQVQSDLETENFEVIPFLFPACAIDAPHRRDRIWFIAYSDRHNDSGTQPGSNTSQGIEKKSDKQEYAQSREFVGAASLDGERGQYEQSFGNASNTNNQGLPVRLQPGIGQTGSQAETWQRGESSRIYSKNTWREFPTQSPFFRRDDGIPNRVDRIKGLGNAWVPQVAYQIFKAIEQYENSQPPLL
jgi:DNA (cytosine-5)-methyltransferase 1